MLKYLLEKEFRQLLRNPALPGLIIGMPIVMMLLLPWAATYEVKEIKLTVIDNDYSTYSKRLVNKLSSSGYFVLSGLSGSYPQALKSIEKGESDIILEIQHNFEKNLSKNGYSDVLISANAINGNKAGLGSAYLTSIINAFASEIREEWGENQQQATPFIRVVPHNRFNTYLDYKVFTVPALMMMLLTIIIGFLPALNIVEEKEKGTIEQINVTPVSKLYFITAKVIPFWVVGLVALTICFLIAAIAYRLYPAGNLLIIYLFSIIYILTMSGLGITVSNYSHTMQQAMFIMFFFLIISILISGLYTPINSMPEWAKKITLANPLRYFVEVMRLVYLKGSGLSELTRQASVLLGFAVVFNTMAILSYKKKS